MYQHTTTPFGRYEKYNIKSDDGQTGMVVTPGCACLLQLTLSGQAVLDGYEVPEALYSNNWFKNVPIFPFPNRLRDGAFSWGGKMYHFPINDGATGNALHGMSREFSTVVERLDLADDSASITLRYQSLGNSAAYPFLFTFDTTYRLRGANRFEGTLTFRNDDERAIPVGLAWHPYFRIAPRIDETNLQLPACELVGIDRRMLPTGKQYPYDDFAALKPLASTVLDNCFALAETGAPAEVLIAGAQGRLRYWQETGPGKFNYLQVFTHPNRDSLAIEPMTCNIDAFHNEEGLLVLEPGESASASFGLTWER